MRLIDLDQTIFVPIVDETRGGVEYEMQMTVGEFFEKFLDGFQPEIVDAVPVEWLEKVRMAMPYTSEKIGVEVALLMWRQEQEERT